MTTPDTFSLLFPDKEKAETFSLDDQAISDLEIDFLLQCMVPSPGRNQKTYDCVRNVLLNPCIDPGTITYRQDITECLITYPELFTAFESLLPIIEALSFYRAGKYMNQSLLYTVVSRICELEQYILCMDTLKHAFDAIAALTGNNRIPSEGLQSLYEMINNTYKDDLFLHMKENLPQLARALRDIKSINVGINLGNSLRPVSATLVSVNTKAFTEKSDTIFNQLFSRPTEELHGISPLHSILSPAGGKFRGVPPSDAHPMMRQLFEDLADVLEKTSKPIQKALNKYIKINTFLFIHIKDELIFFIQGAALLRKLKDHAMPICKPEILPPGERLITIEEHYNINLFIRMYMNNMNNIRNTIVTNRVSFDSGARIHILTGPNQGGKTVYTQGLGLSMVLFQAGLFIPGSKGKISPADIILTHFQIKEQIINDNGRFADEAKRLSGIMKKATSLSIILMNESFASTNYSESLFIAYDIMKIFRVMGVRVMFATHFHDLALQVDSINSAVDGSSNLDSLVSMVEENKGTDGEITRTYKVIPHLPMGKSYAKDIARKYGIGFRELMHLLKERDMV